MSLIVQKFGGTSMGSPELIQRVADRVARARHGGSDVVVVVSAMGHATDELMNLAAAVTTNPRRRHPRELDMLLTAGERIAMALTAMAIRDRGVEAISLTGSQAAIITDETHTGARIEEIRATRVREELAQGRVVIVAGFQGVSRKHEVTTLGRGGSDTTAVALAAALGAERCDIYTDVDAVYTADPRRVPAACPIVRMTYDEMVILAAAGAQVLHPRAVEIGARFGVPIRVLSSFTEGDGAGGTLITRKEPGMEQLALTGLAAEGGYAKLTLKGLPQTMQAMTLALNRLAAAGISVDMVANADTLDGKRHLQITFPAEDLEQGQALCEEVTRELGGTDVGIRPGLSRVTLVGSGMTNRPGVYAHAFQALLDAGIDVHGQSTSAISISLLVDATDEDRTLQVLHTAFELAKGRS